MTEQKDAIISEHMKRIGRMGGLKNKRKGPEFFKWVQSHRKSNKKAEE